MLSLICIHQNRSDYGKKHRGGSNNAFAKVSYYKLKVKIGDIIDMYVNMNKRNMKFSINGKDWGFAFKNKEIGKGTYRMGFCVGNNKCKIQLL